MNFKYFFAVLLSVLVFPVSQSVASSNTPADKPKQVDEIVGQVNQYCGACHKVPPPNVMPKKFWPRAVQAMADLATERMGREFISAEILRDITAYYYGSSPEQLPILPYYQNSNDSQTFITRNIGNKSATPLVVNIKAVELVADGDTQFLICDAEHDQVLLLSKKGEIWQETVLTQVKVPSHTEVVDYDQDGDKDIIVAALGLMEPSSKLAGKVLLLRQDSSGKFTREMLLEGIGRVTDARPVDIDHDGDLDIVIAVFGGGEVGEIAWLENLGLGKHIKHDIIKASGALNVSLADLNNDGKVDIVSLIAQEYEMVLALVNKGAGKFEQVALAEAPHPMFGSTGMRVVDLDSDGDTDILFTNGDAHDLQMDPKPYHGVQWLENMGGFNFRFRDVGRFYGAATAVAGDLDSDGDLDIVAGSWNNYWQDPQRQSLVWFENDGEQNFTRQNIISRPQSIVSFEIKDITGDDRLDIIAVVFRMDMLIAKMMGNNPTELESGPETSAAELLKSRVILLENTVVTH